ncbi:(2Fe-2S)-binding protein, partial [Halorubrum sp. SD626R]|uniref:2Fe-2S iron-sulfur cluster-binding protein n=2 Tax=Halorubrum TaxID=56688 RepID=UPI0010F7B4B4
LVQPDESLLEGAENRGFGWPFSCRGGACANCAVYLVDGEISQPANHIMPDDLAERGFRLSCNGYPVSDELQVVFNVKHLAELDDLILPPGPFTRR